MAILRYVQTWEFAAILLNSRIKTKNAYHTSGESRSEGDL